MPVSRNRIGVSEAISATSATRSLLERRDVIVVASISCIYGLGSPKNYREMALPVEVGQIIDRDELLRELTRLQYTRNNFDFRRGTFRARGDVIEVFPSYEEDEVIRIELFGDEVDRMSVVNPLRGEVLRPLEGTMVYPANHYVTPEDRILHAVEGIAEELDERLHFVQNMHGNIMSAHTAFTTLQTCKTMAVRVKQQASSAQAIAEFLEAHPKVETCRYPGLASFPQKALADAQHKNGHHGGMLWFEVKGGTESGRKLMNSIQRPWSLCENLGAVESICTCPAVMTHANMLTEDRLKVGITDGFVRISCGIEDPEDLIASLKQSLDAL